MIDLPSIIRHTWWIITYINAEKLFFLHKPTLKIHSELTSICLNRLNKEIIHNTNGCHAEVPVSLHGPV